MDNLESWSLGEGLPSGKLCWRRGRTQQIPPLSSCSRPFSRQRHCPTNSWSELREAGVPQDRTTQGP